MVDRTEYRATTDIRGHTVVEANLPCINGLSAWVMVADLGKSQPEDEMFSGLDREGIAQRIVAALRPTAAAAALQQQPEPVAVVGSDWTLLWVGSQPIAHIVQRHPGLKVGSMLYTTPPAISGFMEAFYEMAAMLGVEGAQAKSPQQVYVEQIKPALESALQQQEVPREPVADYEQMRLTLIGQVHELLDIAERHAWTKDPEEKRRTEGSIAHARKVTAPYNYNGAASPSTTRQQEVGSGWKLVPETITEEMHVAAVRTAMRCSGNDDFPRRVWRAMLAAAPSTPEKAGGVLGTSNDQGENRG